MRTTRISLVLFVAMWTFALTACEEEETTPQETPPEATDLADTVDASEVVEEVAGVAAAPSIDITSPANLQLFSATDLDATIAVNVEVAIDLPEGSVGYDVAYYLDGVWQDTTDADSYAFEAGIGRHHLAAMLVSADGEGLPNPESVASIHVRVGAPCDASAGSAQCEDGLSCSNQICVGDADGASCKYGPVTNCCDHDLECDFGQTCVDGVCADCVSDAQCDDGLDCTTDSCDAGVCVHTSPEGSDCCASDADCDDGDSCSQEACDISTGQCVTTATLAPPACCASNADCAGVADHPCRLSLCYYNS